MSEAALDQFVQRRAERANLARRFEFEGETLTVRGGVAPEVANRLSRVRRELLTHAIAAKEAATKNQPLPPDPYSDEDLTALADETALACLDPESHEAWQRLRSVDNPNPLTLTDMYWLCDHLLGRAAEPVPTVPPADSSAGRASTNGSSKDASPSPGKKRRT